jgi:flavin reductase (DIM6/NTAB) family NADH-FMN oxidoreductase RutF
MQPALPDRFRAAMSKRASAVSIATAEDANVAGRAVTLTSLVSISLNPPLVGFFLDPRGATGALLVRGRRVGITILGEQQQALAQRHSTKGRGPLRFASEPGAVLRNGAWVFEGGSAWLAGVIADIVPLGDHALYVVSVSAAERFARAPLAYFERDYAVTRPIAGRDDPLAP